MPINKECLVCKAVFQTYPSRLREGEGKYCSKQCVGLAKVGKPAWNSGKKYPQITGSKNPKWKGDKVGVYAVHQWVKRQKGKATVCVFCKSSHRCGWANRDHKYRRRAEEYISLCQSCHWKFDVFVNGKLHPKPHFLNYQTSTQAE